MSSNYNQLFTLALFDQFKKINIKNIFISPGLRNAPLIIAATKTEGFNIVSEIDERIASYRALGAAKATQTPSVLICTSGTALLNYYPALAEASKTSVPLIVISADRPKDLIGMNTNQTLNQLNIFNQIGIESIDIECPNKELPLYNTIKNILFSINHHCLEHKNSIHLNIPFREFLDEGYQDIDSKSKIEFDEIINNQDPIFQTSLQIKSKHLERPLILIGQTTKNHTTEIYNFLEKNPVLNICDISSGIKLLLNSKTGTLPSIDHQEIENFIVKYQPSCILQIGENLVSKKYDLLFRENKIPWYYYNDNARPIPSSCPTIKLNSAKIDLIDILKSFNSANTETVIDFIHNIDHYKRDIIESGPKLTLPLFSKRYLDYVEDAQYLFLGNSSCIRSFDLYINSATNLKKNLTIYTNRGVSGIEGNIATAASMAELLDKNLDIVIGDISLLHDLTGLKLIKDIKSTIRIFVLNDQEGGIFNLIPLKMSQDAKEKMTTPHSYHFQHISDQFNLDYALIEDELQLKNSILSQPKKSILIEVKIDSKTNGEIYHKLKTIRE